LAHYVSPAFTGDLANIIEDLKKGIQLLEEEEVILR
jgi:hypothetical protein